MLFLNNFLALLPIAMAVAPINLVLTKSHLFEGVREWVYNRHYLLGRLSRCAFCMSFWTIPPMLLASKCSSLLQPFEFFFDTMIVVTLAAPVSWLIYASYSYMHGEQ